MGVGGWRERWEERDNKAGGDVNSQIGSFSRFPPPATLDGWLRQRPERIGETGPSRGLGGGAGGVAGAGLGPVRRVPSRLPGKEWPPETGHSGGKPRGNAQTVYPSPRFAAAGPGRWRGRRSLPGPPERRAAFPAEGGLRGGRWSGGCGFEVSFFAPLHSSPYGALTPSRCRRSHLSFWLHLPSFPFVSPPIVSPLRRPLPVGDIGRRDGVCLASCSPLPASSFPGSWVDGEAHGGPRLDPRDGKTQPYACSALTPNPPPPSPLGMWGGGRQAQISGEPGVQKPRRGSEGRGVLFDTPGQDTP